jgi:spore coat protein U-like protein
MKKSLLFIFLMGAVLIFSGTAMAYDFQNVPADKTDMILTLTIPVPDPECTVTVVALTWPTDYDSVAIPHLDPGSVTVTCNDPNDDYQFKVLMGGGQNFDAGQRRLKNDTNYIAYEIDHPIDTSSLWGTKLFGGLDLTPIGQIPFENGIPFDFSGSSSGSQPVSGRLLAGGDTVSGTYSDTVQVTVLY